MRNSTGGGANYAHCYNRTLDPPIRSNASYQSDRFYPSGCANANNVVSRCCNALSWLESCQQWVEWVGSSGGGGGSSLAIVSRQQRRLCVRPCAPSSFSEHPLGSQQSAKATPAWLVAAGGLAGWLACVLMCAQFANCANGLRAQLGTSARELARCAPFNLAAR